MVLAACGGTGTTNDDGDSLGAGGGSTSVGAGGTSTAHSGHGGSVAGGSAGSSASPTGSSGTLGASGGAGHVGGSAGATSAGSSGASGASGKSASAGAGGASGNVGFAGGASGSSGSGDGNGASSGSDGSGASAGSSVAGGTGQGGETASGGAGGTSSNSDCASGTQLVYVFTLDNEIYSFDPPTKVFTKIVSLDCGDGLTANSMAIDRNLIAWLNYFDESGNGAIYTYDLKAQTPCQDSGIDLPDGFTQIGMGFSTDTAGGSSETLYIDGIGGGGLAKIDMATKQVVSIGDFGNDNKVSGESAELTGTGDARLYGYFTTDPVRVAEIDKTNGNTLTDVALKGVSPPNDWAFSFWGAEFYLYAAPGSNSSGNSSVIQYDPATDTVDQKYVADTGFIIIGAGVSTCAPTQKP